MKSAGGQPLAGFESSRPRPGDKQPDKARAVAHASLAYMAGPRLYCTTEAGASAGLPGAIERAARVEEEDREPLVARC